jgi:hypothetical protein
MTPLLSLGQAAEYLGISTSGLRKIVERSRKLLANGKPPLITWCQHGKWGRIRFREVWLDDYIDGGIPEPSEAVPIAKRPRTDHGETPSSDHGIGW